MTRETIKPHDHPDFVGGWVWTELEMRWIEQRIAEAVAAERNRTWTQQHWTEYEHAIAAAEREACAKACEEIKGVKLQGYEFAAAIRARGQA